MVSACQVLIKRWLLDVVAYIRQATVEITCSEKLTRPCQPRDKNLSGMLLEASIKTNYFQRIGYVGQLATTRSCYPERFARSKKTLTLHNGYRCRVSRLTGLTIDCNRFAVTREVAALQSLHTIHMLPPGKLMLTYISGLVSLV